MKMLRNGLVPPLAFALSVLVCTGCDSSDGNTSVIPADSPRLNQAQSDEELAKKNAELEAMMMSETVQPN